MNGDICHECGSDIVFRLCEKTSVDKNGKTIEYVEYYHECCMCDETWYDEKDLRQNLKSCLLAQGRLHYLWYLVKRLFRRYK